MITIDNSGPLICLNSRSESSRAAWATIHAQRLSLVFPPYAMEDMLTSGLLYGN